MRKGARIVSWLVLSGLLLILPRVYEQLPAPPEGMARSKYSGFSGVLRVWFASGFEAGNGFARWLNESGAAFEKTHPGVYVMFIPVDAEKIALFASDPVNPPDVILFSPGMLDSGENLVPLWADNVRATLARAGEWAGETRALPVAMGMYGLAMNESMLPETPLSWENTAAPAKARGSKTAPALLAIPVDGAYTSVSAAALSILTRDGAPAKTENVPAGDGMELRLLITPAPTPAPTEEAPPLQDGADTYLPASLIRPETGFAAFANGGAAAAVCTQRDIERLNRLADTGRAPEWRMETADAPYTDQLLMAGVADIEREDGEARCELAARLVRMLLSEARQKALAAARAFPVIDMAPLFADKAGFGELEAACMSARLIVPNAFSNAHMLSGEALFRRLQAGELTARQALAALRAGLTGR